VVSAGPSAVVKATVLREVYPKIKCLVLQIGGLWGVAVPPSRERIFTHSTVGIFMTVNMRLKFATV
jgi:hypothetical protein